MRVSGRDRHTRIDRDDAGMVGEQRVDVELADLGQVGRHLRQFHQRQGNRPLVGGGDVAIGFEPARRRGCGR